MLKKIIYKIMDPIADILKPFKIDVGSFFSYVLGIIVVCLSFDRVLELFSVLFTGQFVSYWSPLMYAFAYFLICAGYSILCASPYCKTILQPVTYYIYYSIAFRIITATMVAQWVNQIAWFLLMSCSNFKYIATNLPEVIAPAITSITILYPG